MPAPTKEKLVELFDFARRRILQSMDLRHCPHAGFFHGGDDRCLDCDQGMECIWMNHNDELVALGEKSETELRQQLLIAVDFVDSTLTPHHLSRRNCQCDNCVWLRQVNDCLSGG